MRYQLPTTSGCPRPVAPQTTYAARRRRRGPPRTSRCAPPRPTRTAAHAHLPGAGQPAAGAPACAPARARRSVDSATGQSGSSFASRAEIRWAVCRCLRGAPVGLQTASTNAVKGPVFGLARIVSGHSPGHGVPQRLAHQPPVHAQLARPARDAPATPQHRGQAVRVTDRRTLPKPSYYRKRHCSKAPFLQPLSAPVSRRPRSRATPSRRRSAPSGGAPPCTSISCTFKTAFAVPSEDRSGATLRTFDRRGARAGHHRALPGVTLAASTHKTSPAERGGRDTWSLRCTSPVHAVL